MNEQRILRNLRVCWLVGGVVAVVALVITTQISPLAGGSAQAACAGSFTIDFAGFSPGTIVGEQGADSGVHISGAANGDFPDAIVVFDSNAPATHDPDLEVHIGNILVLAENINDVNGDGLVDDPDENNFGGTQIFEFDQPVHIGSFKFIDKDHDSPATATAFDPSGTAVASAPIVNMGNASVQTVTLNADNVRRLEIQYVESGALTGVEVTCPVGATATPVAESVTGPGNVAPTSAPQHDASAAATATPPTAVAAAATGPQPLAAPNTGGDPKDGAAAAPNAALLLLGLALAAMGGTVLATYARKRV